MTIDINDQPTDMGEVTLDYFTSVQVLKAVIAGDELTQDEFLALWELGRQLNHLEVQTMYPYWTDALQGWWARLQTRSRLS
jgi:hypothetical protein